MQRPRKHEQKASINQGESLTIEQAISLEQLVREGKSSVLDRFKLIGFCIKQQCSTETTQNILFNQLSWLIRNMPDLALFSTVTASYAFLNSDHMFECYKVLLDVLEQREHTEELLLNAVIFLRTCKRDIVLLNRVAAELEALRQQSRPVN